MKKQVLILILVVFSLPVFSQALKTVEGEYVYYVPENVTLEEAKITALNRAINKALAEEFGTNVYQSNSTIVSNINGNSNIDFMSLGGSEVKGEWIETIGEPQYKVTYVDNMLVVQVNVKGNAREIVTTPIDLSTHILKNGTDERFESDEFRQGDQLYLMFQSPVKGYLAVYLIDADLMANCLLPYRNQTDGIYKIAANKKYLFFSSDFVEQSEKRMVDEYVMGTTRTSEYNQIYIIFSTNEFVKAKDDVNDGELLQELKNKGYKVNGLPRELKYDDFQKWLVKCRKSDKNMNVRINNILVSK